MCLRLWHTCPPLRALPYVPRFSKQLTNSDYLIASATHPRFKLSWLCDADLEQSKWKVVEHEYNRRLAASLGQRRDHEEQPDAAELPDDDFFQIGRAEEGGSPSTEELGRWRLANTKSQGFSCLGGFPIIKAMFTEYNTALPSSASVERVFSMAKDTFSHKRGSLTDGHFESQLLLRCNKSFLR